MKHKPTGKYIGLKQCYIKSTDELFLKQVKIEIDAQKSCDSDFIVKLYGSYCVENFFYMPMEYMNLGSLTAVIK